MNVWTLHNGDCIEVLRSMPADSVDAVVTDPPYDLTFMGKAWDGTGIAFRVETWTEVLRVLKPGGHLLAAGGTRTYHRMVCAIEDAGFEVRDSIHWLYSTGFPKSRSMRDIDRPELGTALKPAHEPIVLARKPLAAATVAANVLTHGTGALNIDACRVSASADYGRSSARSDGTVNKGEFWTGTLRGVHDADIAAYANPAGRWPANVVLSHLDACNGSCAPGCAVAELDRQSGERKSSGVYNPANHQDTGTGFIGKATEPERHRMYNDTGGASRFYPVFDAEAAVAVPFKYQSKPSRAERNKGLERTRTVKYYLPNKDGELCAATVRELVKVTSGIPTVSWHIGESGASITGQCPSDSLSITLMAIKRITTSAILNLSTLSRTSDCTAGASCAAANGGSHAANVGCSSEQIPTIISDATALDQNVSSVLSSVLSLASNVDAWSAATNFHATVKPVALMRWLCRLVTPRGGTVLDPFCGSGSTGVAAIAEGMQFIGIEQDADYCELARRRLDDAALQREVDMVFE